MLYIPTLLVSREIAAFISIPVLFLSTVQRTRQPSCSWTANRCCNWATSPLSLSITCHDCHLPIYCSHCILDFSSVWRPLISLLSPSAMPFNRSNTCILVVGKYRFIQILFKHSILSQTGLQQVFLGCSFHAFAASSTSLQLVCVNDFQHIWDHFRCDIIFGIKEAERWLSVLLEVHWVLIHEVELSLTKSCWYLVQFPKCKFLCLDPLDQTLSWKDQWWSGCPPLDAAISSV